MYAEVFREVIGVGDMKLLIVGYGFGDEHINAAIADAVKSCGLQVFIWDSRQDLRAHMDRVPHGADIWSGLISISSRKLHEVFPSNQAITEEYRRICEACFGAI